MVSHSPHGMICSIRVRNSFFFVRACASSSLRYDRLITLICTPFVRCCPKSPCGQKDNMDQIYAGFETADVVVFASLPCFRLAQSGRGAGKGEDQRGIPSGRIHLREARHVGICHVKQQRGNAGFIYFSSGRKSGPRGQSLRRPGESAWSMPGPPAHRPKQRTTPRSELLHRPQVIRR